MKHLPFAAKKMSDFMLQVGLLKTKPNLEPILDAQFVKKYAETLKQ
jgi:NitT/TauT family transport system substrate-binding protein